MSRPSAISNPATVLVIGPDPAETGGMAAVVCQMLGLDFGCRYRTKLFATTSSPGSHERGFQRIRRHARHLLQLRRTIRETGARIVHIHTCSGFSFFRSLVDQEIAQRAGCATILHIHGAAFDEFYGRMGRINKAIIDRGLARAERVIALSQGWRRKLERMAPAARIAVIENAVHLPPLPTREPNGRCAFVLLARMDDWKGIDDLLDAAATLHVGTSSFRLTLAGPAGSAGDRDALEAKIRDRGLTGIVRYVGPVHGRDKETLLASSDVYVQPSHHEGMPIALLEAMSYGLPIVATQVGAVGEVVTHRREGLLVRPHDPCQLANAMREMMTCPQLRTRASVAARTAAAGRFHLSRFHDDWESLYDGLFNATPAISTPPPATPPSASTPCSIGGSARDG